MLELRKYQEDVLESLREFLDKMLEQKQRQDKINKLLASQNEPLEQRNLAELAWRKIGKENYIDRKDGIGKSIPHICLKVPTGGGKTLLATHAAKIINQHYFRRNTGLILWVVPSDAIYQQTLKAFKDIEHPYRQILDAAAPRKRAKILERQNIFSPTDVEDDLSVMLLMIQAAGKENKESLRMFRDNDRCMDFFPDTNDYQRHQELIENFPNLCVHQGIGEAKNVKYSLGNVLKMLRPIVVLDEGHTAKSVTRRETFNQFNPRFILELSATPPEKYSNVLVNVPGKILKDEEMIKLPIQLKNRSNDDWKTTLSDSCERLKEIAQQAKRYMGNGGRYIRPILLVRVENTGREQRGRGTIHAEDVREYLTAELSFREDEVRIKSGELDEISKEDLLSPACPVRVVITKDALKEGWDCPFAYVLTLLDKPKSPQTLTQLIGRVLRQPYAQQTGIDDLDTAHVFCFNQNVNKLVEGIKNSLEHHGLGDMKSGAISTGETEKEKVSVNRRGEFRDLDIPMPRVLYQEKSKVRPLNYERDILSNINWDKLKCEQPGLLLEAEQALTEGRVDIGKHEIHTDRIAMEGEASNAFFARHLADIIPNPWQAMRIVEDVRPLINKRGTSRDVYNDRMNIVRQMRGEVGRQKEKESQSLFEKKLKANKIIFKLDATNSSWRVPKGITLKHNGTPKYLTRETGEQLALSLFEKYLERDFNEFEKKVAGYLDEEKALGWWHRVAARKEYGLQGWRKHIVYPDFLALLSKDKNSSLILETKGRHLSDNDDTKYKKKLFKLLEENYTNVGDVSISGVGEQITLRIIYDTDDQCWKRELKNLVN